MGTLKVDNIQKRDGTALITDGAASTTLLTETALRNSNVGLTLISTQTASSSATINFDSSVITTDYESYVVIINNIRPVTDQATLRMKWSNDNGSSFLSESYGARHSGGKTQTGADSSGSSNNAGYYDHGFYQNNAAGKGSSFEFRFNNLTVSGGGHKCFFGNWVTDFSDDTNYYGGDINGMVRNNTSVINYIQFYMSSGNVLAGTFKLYGIV